MRRGSWLRAEYKSVYYKNYEIDTLICDKFFYIKWGKMRGLRLHASKLPKLLVGGSRQMGPSQHVINLRGKERGEEVSCNKKNYVEKKPQVIPSMYLLPVKTASLILVFVLCNPGTSFQRCCSSSCTEGSPSTLLPILVLLQIQIFPALKWC